MSQLDYIIKMINMKQITIISLIKLQKETIKNYMTKS